MLQRLVNTRPSLLRGAKIFRTNGGADGGGFGGLGKDARGGNRCSGAVESLDSRVFAFRTVVKPFLVLFFFGTRHSHGSGGARGRGASGSCGLAVCFFNLKLVVVRTAGAVFASHAGGVLAAKTFGQVVPSADDGLA